MRHAAIAGLVLALLAAPAARAQGGPMDRFLEPFASNDGLARAVAFQRFEQEVPAADRAAALVTLWNAAAGRKDRDVVRGSVLAYLRGRAVADLPWTPELRAVVQGALRDPAPRLRQLAMMAAVKRNGGVELRDDIVRALDDDDEQTRDLAIGEVARWPDHRALLEGYVKRNAGKKAHAATVGRAQLLIQKGGIK